MSCVNINNPLFKAFFKSEPNIFLAQLNFLNELNKKDVSDELEIEDQQLATPKENYFSKLNEWDFTSRAEPLVIDNKVLSNLSNKFNMNSLSKENQDKMVQVIAAVGKREAVRDYYENDSVVRTPGAIINKLYDIEQEKQINKLEFANLENYDKVDDTKASLNELLSLSGVSYTNEENKLC